MATPKKLSMGENVSRWEKLRINERKDLIDKREWKSRKEMWVDERKTGVDLSFHLEPSLQVKKVAKYR